MVFFTKEHAARYAALTPHGGLIKPAFFILLVKPRAGIFVILGVSAEPGLHRVIVDVVELLLKDLMRPQLKSAKKKVTES